MNAVELRYKIFKALHQDHDVDGVATLVSPAPGEPVKVKLYDVDGRHFTITVTED